MDLDLKPIRVRTKEDFKELLERMVAFGTLLGIIVQIITVFYFIRTVNDAKRTTEILEKAVSASHIPILSVQIISIDKDLSIQSIRIRYKVSNSGDSFANHLAGNLELDDTMGHKLEVGEEEDYVGDNSGGRVEPATTKTAGEFVQCLLPKEQEIYEAYIFDSGSWELYQMYMTGNGVLNISFSFDDMFSKPYYVTERFMREEGQDKISDMDLNGYSAYLPPNK